MRFRADHWRLRCRRRDRQLAARRDDRSRRNAIVTRPARFGRAAPLPLGEGASERWPAGSDIRTGAFRESTCAARQRVDGPSDRGVHSASGRRRVRPLSRGGRRRVETGPCAERSSCADGQLGQDRIAGVLPLAVPNGTPRAIGPPFCFEADVLAQTGTHVGVEAAGPCW